MDLALIAPLAIMAGILLLRRSAWGYLLASVAVLKGLTMALAVSTMAINMALKGVPNSQGMLAGRSGATRKDDLASRPLNDMRTH